MDPDKIMAKPRKMYDEPVTERVVPNVMAQDVVNKAHASLMAFRQTAMENLKSHQQQAEYWSEELLKINQYLSEDQLGAMDRERGR